MAETKGSIAYFLATQQVGDSKIIEAKVALLEFSRRLARKAVQDWIQNGFLRTDLEAMAWQRRLFCMGPSDDWVERMTLYEAVKTNATQQVIHYIQHKGHGEGREDHAVVEIRGEPGSGKSNVALQLASWCGLAPTHIPQSVHFYHRPFLEAMATGRGSLILDEESENVGEGSRTMEALLRKQEGRLRQEELNLFYCAPNRHTPPERPLTLETIGVSHARREVLVLVYRWSELVGHAYIPYCPAPIWNAYRPLKQAALKAARSMDNPDAALRRGGVLGMVLDDGLMARVKSMAFDPEVVYEEVTSRFAGIYTQAELRRMSNLVLNVARVWHEDEISEKYLERIGAIAEQGYLPHGAYTDELRRLGLLP